MLKLEQQWQLSLNVLTNSKFKFNLYIEYPSIVKNPEDLEDIVSFLELYIIKHGRNFFEINEVGEIKILNHNLPLLLAFLI